jgi:hypothetical protein
MAMSITDLYKVHLKHREAYLLYLAKGATDDITVLPEPLTDAEQVLYGYCVAAAEAVAEAAAEAAASAASSGSGSESTGG